MSNIVKLKGQRKSDIPEFIGRSDIDAMKDAELDSLVSSIRTRRMNCYLIYKQTKDEKAALEHDKIRTRIEKKCEQIIKTINSCDKTLDRLEKQINELRGLRLQAGMEIIR